MKQTKKHDSLREVIKTIIVGVLIVMLFAAVFVAGLKTKRALHMLRNGRGLQMVQKSVFAPSIEGGGCSESREFSCIQTLLVSEFGKIESVHVKETGKTALRLTNIDGREYIFSDPNEPFIEYERAVSNGTKSIEKSVSGYYLVTAANRGRDSNYSFEKVYEVWLGEVLDVKNIISEKAVADEASLKKTPVVDFFMVDRVGRLSFVAYNIALGVVEQQDDTIDKLLTRLAWYKNKSKPYYLARATDVAGGYVLEFSEEGEDKGVVTKMVYWDVKGEKLVTLK